MKRSYRQFCGVARALDVLGDRWALLIARNLLLGPKRYSLLLEELPGITTNLLAARLKGLESAGLVERRDEGWALSTVGLGLEPVVMELGRFGMRYMDAPKKTDTVNLGWALLSMKRRYQGKARGVLGLETEAQKFELAFTPARLDVQQRAAVRPDAMVRGPVTGFQRILFRGESLAALVQKKVLTVEGDAQRLLSSLGVVP